MKTTVRVGQMILATDENRKLVVDQVTPEHLSGKFSFDFTGVYVDPAGVNRNGHLVHGGRAFKYDVDNWTIVNQ